MKKKGGQPRPSFPGASGMCEGYSTIYVSREPNRSGEPHPPLGSDDLEVSHLAPILRQSQSTPQSPVSSLEPSSPNSPHHSERSLYIGTTPFITNADDIQLLHVPRLTTPLNLMHSRATSTQFAGAWPRSRSHSPSPHPPTYPHSITLESATASSARSRSPSPC